jgi:hypothetical protein
MTLNPRVSLQFPGVGTVNPDPHDCFPAKPAQKQLCHKGLSKTGRCWYIAAYPTDHVWNPLNRDLLHGISLGCSGNFREQVSNFVKGQEPQHEPNRPNYNQNLDYKTLLDGWKP